MAIKVLFLFAFVSIYLMVFILLKPFRVNMRRPFSTMALKVSFLIYLAAALFFTFIFMFYNGEKIIYLEDVNDPRASKHFILMLSALFIPNIGIFFRRKFRKRTFYNSLFTFINLMSLGYYIFLILKISQ